MTYRPSSILAPRARRPHFACSVLVMLFLPLVGGAQDVERMDEVVRSYVDRMTFMGSVLVARGDETLLSRGYGSANLEWNIPNSPTTKFRIGSVTKQFTAASILLLEERGELDTQDFVKAHMTDAPAAWDEVTIYHLLTHTAGIPSITNFPEFDRLKVFPMTIEESVAAVRDKPLEFEPGERMRYSNSGYMLLGYLIEKISGQDYESFLRDNIFEPLGMRNSGVDSNAMILPMRASGYSPSVDGIVNAPFVHMSIPHAAGALYSTTEDLLRWTQGLFGGELLSPESLTKMTTPFKNNYALGLEVSDAGGRTAVGHGGGIEGFNARLSYYPEEEIAVAVLGNLNGAAPDQIATQLGALAHGESVLLPTERQEVELPTDVLDDYVGSYRIAPDFLLTIRLEDGRLISQATGQDEVEIYAEAQDRFFLKVVDAQLEFLRGEDGAVEAVILHQGGSETRAPRL